ncbi:MAG TPA: PBP1A family penicillin-binding protein [Thermoanaerobaculia bacterium]|nr:PBP1A family penicillin-binding protein [Thermoanaerobaculia bacterium]
MTEIPDDPTVPPAKPAPPRRNWRSRLPPRRTVFRAISWTVGAFLVLFLVLGIWVYRSSVGRFQIRKLRLPTRIYADITPLQPGAPMQTDDLLEKLDRLGYRDAERLAQPGDFLRSGEGVDIFTRAFTHPTGEYRAEQIRVVLNRSSIESVVSLREARPLDRAALEPELLTSVLSEQLENRSPVTLQQMPQHLQDAVVAAEDSRFWHHPGVDPLGIVRAVFRNVKSKGVSEGGSTLTQQLVKNYFLTSERTYKRKVIEAFMAVILDARYSKKEILEAYLNDIYLGRNRSISILGVGEASRFYFGKPVSEINIAEAAMLAGMIPSPNNISPFNNPEAAMRKRNQVLDLMLKQKKINRAQYDEARSAKLPRKPFRRRSGLTSMPFYVDRVLDELATDYGIDDVKGRGLRIYTAIDLNAQDAAARVLESSLQSIEKRSRKLRTHDPELQGAIIHLDVPTGEIRALVGGRNYDRSQFNRALKSKRLVGSLFKPFVYLTAFEPSLSNQNITPATQVDDTRFVLKRRWSEDWSPRNYDGRYMGKVTVRMALEHSLNAASVRIGLASGIDAILKTARTLGVQTELDDNPSILLGATGIPPIEMAEAYSTIARQGARVTPRAIRFVTDDRGKALAGAGEAKPVQVFPQRDVYLLTHVMEGVVNRGTAASSRSMGFRKVAAGKTGTTNDKRDAWFIGFTPQTLALTWVGFDDNDPTGLSGSDAAVPMWTRYMLAVTAGDKNMDFVPPQGISFAEVDETSGGLVTQYCPRNVIVREAFKVGTEPTHPCPTHSATVVPTVPMYDEFGNPITMTTTDAPMTDTGGFTVPPDSTLTGGVFRPPPPTTTAPPPQQPLPTTTTTAEEEEEEEPPPPPPPTDTSTTTSGPPSGAAGSRPVGAGSTG